MRKTTKNSYVVISMIMIFVILSSLAIFKTRDFVMKNLNSFSEVSLSDFSIGSGDPGYPESREDILEILQSTVVENEDQMGFTEGLGAGCADLYHFHSLVSISEAVESNVMRTELRKKTDIICGVNTALLEILDLIYYIEICDHLGIGYNSDAAMDDFEKYYDESADLFFLEDSNDDFHTKTIISVMCVKALPELVSDERFDIADGLLRVYESYIFGTDPSVTLYNSGGDILYAMSVLGIADESVVEARREWFGFWSERYEDMDIGDLGAALAFSEYIKIAQIFDEDIRRSDKIRNYYMSLGAKDLNDDTDYLMLSNSMVLAGERNNDVFNKAVETKVSELIGNRPALEIVIDPVATVHGVMLAKCSGFGINRSKLQNYINECYEKTEDAKQPADIINMLYYAIILDEQNNNYKISASDDFVRKHVDRTIKALKFGADINNDIVSVRKAVEIVMDLQIHGRDIRLNMGQVRKIRRGIIKALDRETITGSVLLTDLYLIDHALDAGLVDEERLTEVYDLVGGDCMYNAHRFMICFDRAGIDRYADEQKAYVRSNNEKTLGSVFMGLSIVKHSNTGGMKE
ncbi:hypothetical protein EOM86_05050 [Candidatus Nomurabacteria bacterium]|nr:hypothetical protein [Candidatus Nomurabacteria bacterium]